MQMPVLDLRAIDDAVEAEVERRENAGNPMTKEEIDALWNYHLRTGDAEQAKLARDSRPDSGIGW